MWDLMYPRGYRSHPRRNRHKGGRCRACKADIGTVKINGHKTHLNYCEKHYCAKIQGGILCQAQNNGRTLYCDHHVRCQATGDEGRCWRTVKEDDPMKYKFCKDHGCGYPTCTSRRTDPSHPQCALHRCGNQSCDKPRAVDVSSAFCERHTCDAAACTAEVDGAGDPPRLCDSHRRCAAAGCLRRCHTRGDSPLAGKWCGAHYCHRAGCEEQRSPDSDRYCVRHLCVEPGCAGGLKDVGGAGKFCDRHCCAAAGCPERRDLRVAGADHCAVHICVVDGCAKPAAAGRKRCSDHTYCKVDGCREWISIENGRDGEIRHPECEKHHLPPCLAPTLTNTPCDKRISPNPNNRSAASRFCDDHACGVRACPNARSPTSLSYCAAHKCAAGACQEQVRNASSALLHHHHHHLLLGGSLGSRFCAAHACAGDGGRCGAEVAAGGAGGGRLFCRRHKCDHRGCRAEATRRGRRGGAGACERHYRRRKEEAAGGGCGGGGPFGMMPMGGPMMGGGGFPPFFGGGPAMYDSGDSSSDSDDGGRPMVLPFGGPFF